MCFPCPPPHKKNDCLCVHDRVEGPAHHATPTRSLPVVRRWPSVVGGALTAAVLRAPSSRPALYALLVCVVGCACSTRRVWTRSRCGTVQYDTVLYTTTTLLLLLPVTEHGLPLCTLAVGAGRGGSGPSQETRVTPECSVARRYYTTYVQCCHSSHRVDTHLTCHRANATPPPRPHPARSCGGEWRS